MSRRYLADFITAGALAREVRAFGKSLIVKGASYNDVIDKVNKKIVELGARAAFPPQIALDHVAAHYLPQPDQDIFFSNEVVKLDIGVCYKGAIGDCAVTIDLSGKNQKLVDAAEAALLAAEKSIHVGMKTSEIGRIISDTITSLGFSPVRNLAGHGLGYYVIHTKPSIPNYDDRSNEEVKPGMTFAIEPFATTGKGWIFDAGEPTIFSLVRNQMINHPPTRAVLKKIEAFQGLPFATHNLISADCNLEQVRLALSELISRGVIHGYAPLVEETRGLVAQAENSVLVDLDGKVTITTR